MVDSGSDINLMNEEIADEITRKHSYETNLSLSGIGNAKVKVNRAFKADIMIDERKYYDVLFHVVPKMCMLFDIILGNDF